MLKIEDQSFSLKSLFIVSSHIIKTYLDITFYVIGKYLEKISLATRLGSTCLVSVSAIREVSSSLILSCLDQDETGNSDPNGGGGV